MAKVVTMGEIMLRLSTKNCEKIVQADEFAVHYGGAEANAAVSLAGFGVDTQFVTALPDNPVGDACLNELRRYGVGTDFIARSGDRLGIYFVEPGSSVRPSRVTYDRANSAIAAASVSEFDFDAIFEGADWFHVTGITPALSDSARELTFAAVRAAKKHGVTVSCDLNFRKKLWSAEKAKTVMTELMEYVDVCIGNEEDAEKVLGFRPAGTDVTKGELNLKGYEDIFRQMCSRFGFRYVVSSLRESHSASDNGWSACVMDGKTGEFYHSRTYHIAPIVDRVGGGDSLAAGFISGILGGRSMEQAIEFAAAASALKHTIPSDFNHVTCSEVETLMSGDASGRVQR